MAGPEPKEPFKSIFEEADYIINQDRRGQYPPPHEEHQRLSMMWSGILNTRVEPRHVPLMMVCLKLVREAHKHKRDNLVDGCGYLGNLEQALKEGYEEDFIADIWTQKINGELT